MTIAVDWDVKHQFKQTNKQTEHSYSAIETLNADLLPYEGRSKITLTFAVTSTGVLQFKKNVYHDTTEHSLIKIR